VTPPPLAEGSPAQGADARAAERELRRRIFVAAWTLVRDKHYDKSLGGLDWNAERAKWEPLAIGAPDAATFYRLTNQMIGTLGSRTSR
jgi:tricorn protease